MEYVELTGTWNYPNAIKAGAGSVAALPQLCRDRGISKPLVVTDPGVSTLPMTASMLESLAEGGLSAELFDAIKLNPSGANVEAGVEDYRKGGCEHMLGVQGHPEFTPGYARDLMHTRLDRIPPEVVERAEQSLQQGSADHRVFGEWMLRFFRGGG